MAFQSTLFPFFTFHFNVSVFLLGLELELPAPTPPLLRLSPCPWDASFRLFSSLTRSTLPWGGPD